MTNPPNYGPPQPAWGPPPSPAPAPKPSRVPMILALVGIFIAIALGVVALLRPAAQAAAPAVVAPRYSEQQVAEAKKAVCGAYKKVVKASSGAAGLRTDDLGAKFAISVNSRLTSVAASNYLAKMLSENPATPPDLREGIRAIASAYDDVVLGQLAGATDEETKPAYDKLGAGDEAVAAECK